MKNDYIVRATAANGQIRAFAATTRNLVEEARSRHNTSPVATAALGRLMTGAVMMGVMMKGDRDLLTLQIVGDGPLQGITVTADAKGTVKGYVENPMVLIPANSIGKLDVRGAVGNGSLTVIRDLGLKEPYVGRIDLPSGEIAEDLTYYFAVSEQVPSTCGLGVLMNKEDATVKQAGGFIVQLMPGTADEVIDKLEQNLSGIQSVTTMLEAGDTPEQILEHLLGNMDLEILDTIPASFCCNCSWERVSRALISLGQKELQNLIDEGQPVELLCHFCNEAYTFTVDDLKEMLKVAVDR
ncbi:MAG: Hsp33 family molecular chaperone HslO [Lachnospiraceae bacterium]|nr:Hsp33 family molecular chaperone HslO [Lachnospiraceae bacterium]